MKLKYAALAVATALTLVACGKKEEAAAPAADKAAAPAPAAEVVVKIGHAAPLSGPVAHLGKDTEYGVGIALDEANAEGVTIAGQKVKFELVSEDDQADPKTATQVAQRFIDNKVAGVIGHLTSGATVPASKIYADNGIPQISPSATNPSYTAQGYTTAFRLIADDSQQGKALAEFAVKDLAAKTVAIIDDRTAYGQGLADEFAKAVEAAGAKVVKREFTNDKATDFTAILTSIKSEKPDLLFYGGMDAQSGPMAKQMKKLGLESKLLSGDGMQTPVFLQLAGDAAEGKYASQAGAPKDKFPGYTSFAEKLKAKHNQEVQLYATYAYDATRVMIDAMKRADSVDPSKYLPEIGKSQFEGATGKVSFDDKGNRQNAAVTIYQVKNGQWEVVNVVGGQQ